ncbi:hypothetical protein Micau_2433 [Micromonospora aurantiaca ATCC 27029]|nr:hypothetical protein Micau_2433 [Micromonospora aurantiaca ATCC 27029]
MLVALKAPQPFDALLKINSSGLHKKLIARVGEFFEGELRDYAEGVLATVRERLEARHSVMHSIWTPDDRQRLFDAKALQALGSQEDLDDLIRQRGETAAWRTLHPKANAPGPQTLEELERIRIELEEGQDMLTALRFTLAGALFAGKPAGARRVLNPRDLEQANSSTFVGENGHPEPR